MNTAHEKAKNDKSEAKQLSRLEALREKWKPDWSEWVDEATIEALRESFMPKLPPIEGGEYLANLLWEIGPVTPNGMGSSPLSFLEIQAWQNCTGVSLRTSEVMALRTLSIAYLNESQQATDIDRLAPWTEFEDAQQVPSRKTESLRDSLRALANL